MNFITRYDFGGQMISKLLRVVELLKTPGAIRAFSRWPLFSLAAFQIVSRAKEAGVQPATVIDVGANIGQFSVAASRLFLGAEIFPIEPDSFVAKTLRKNIGPDISRNLYVTAIGDHIGMATFNVNSDSQVSSLLPLGKDRIGAFPDSVVLGQVSVPMTTLDELFGSCALKEPIFLKIDVQGFEDRVIAGAEVLLKRVKWVLMEVAFSKLYEGERDFESLVELLKAHGFRFARPMNFHISPKTGEIIEMDALFERMS